MGTDTIARKKTRKLGPKALEECPHRAREQTLGRITTLSALEGGRAKGRAALQERRATAAATLRRDFADAAYWAELARTRGLRLPQWHRPVTTGGMRRWLRKLGLSVEEYYRFSGERTLKDFARANPTWPLRAWVGVLLDSVVALDSEHSAAPDDAALLGRAS